MRKHTISFKNAFCGLRWVVTSQPNYLVHFFLSLLTIIGSYLLKVSYSEFLTLITLIFLGLTIETINTALEQTNDAIDLKRREDIGLAKDIAAGAMLMFSIGAFTIACIIFIPKLILAFNI